MKNIYFLLLGFILLFNGCTKNNQNSPAHFAYLNVNQTFIASHNQFFQTYDIDNDGQVDWGFIYEQPIANSNEVQLSAGEVNLHLPAFVVDTSRKILPIPVGFNIGSGLSYSEAASIFDNTAFPQNPDFNISLGGIGDFYLGFRSQNPSYTNTFYGWARLNLSADGKTLIVKDMALNTVNGGSINAGQH